MPIRTLSIALMVGLAISSSAHSANLWWDTDGGAPGVGGTGAWEDVSGNWSTNNTGTSPTTWDSAVLDTAIFEGTPGTVTVGPSISAAGMVFNVGGYVVTGSSVLTTATVPFNYVTGTGNTIVSSDMVRFRDNSASSQAMNIFNSASGTLEINSNFSYTGGTGVVTGTTPIVINAADVNGVTIVNGSLTGSGFVTSTMRINSVVDSVEQLGTVILNNDNSAFSSVRPRNGTLLLGNALALGTAGSGFGDSSQQNVAQMRMLTNGAFSIANNIAYNTATVATTRVLGGNTADVSTFSGTLTLGGSLMTPVMTAAAGGRVNFTGDMTNQPGNAIRIGENSSATGIVAFNRATGIATPRGVNVDHGTLLILGATGTNSNTGSGNVAVASGATLGGTGRAGGLVESLAAGSRFSPGDMDAFGSSQIGELRLHGGLMATNGATFALDINGPSVDTIDFGSAALDLGGTVTFDFTDLGSVDLGSPYSLFAGTGAWSGTPTFVFNAPANSMLDPSFGTNGYIWNTGTNELSVQFAVVPEPASMALVLIGGIGGLLMVARRKHGQTQSKA